MNIEKSFLKKILTNSNFLDRALFRGIDSSFFIEPSYSWLMDVIIWFYAKYKTLPTKEDLRSIVESSTKLDDFRKQDILIVLEDLFNREEVASDFNFLLDSLVSHYQENQLKMLLFSASSKLRDGRRGVLEDLKEKLIELENKVNFKGDEIDLGKDSLNRIIRYQEGKVDNTRGVEIGFPTLDNLTWGLKEGWVVVVLGANKSGKSVFLLNSAINAYLRGKNVLFISLEIPKDQVIYRYDSCRSGIVYDKLVRGLCSPDELDVLKGILEEDSKRSNIFYVVDIVNFSAHTLYSLVKRLPFKPDLVVIDYMGLMKTSSKSEKAWEVYSKIGLELREVARSLKFPVLTAMQVNREAYKNNEKDVYGVEDIALSFLLTCHVDLVMSLKVLDRQALYENNSNNGVELVATIVASRVSRGGKFSIWADFSRMHMKEFRMEINNTDSNENSSVKASETIKW